MLQLFELIPASPLGAFFISAMRDTVYAAMILSDCEECGFNDLGKLLFGGLVLALAGRSRGVVLLAAKETKENSRSQFVSIRSDNRNK